MGISKYSTVYNTVILANNRLRSMFCTKDNNNVRRLHCFHTKRKCLRIRYDYKEKRGFLLDTANFEEGKQFFATDSKAVRYRDLRSIVLHSCAAFYFIFFFLIPSFFALCMLHGQPNASRGAKCPRFC
uniref:Transmembrane protein n=1 Tax=Palpitomonas bilix TaxID=652834 RepID=A0A7S3D3J2_9EUKA